VTSGQPGATDKAAICIAAQTPLFTHFPSATKAN
jgi:hypothetical protein